MRRSRGGKSFSIVAVAEGAINKDDLEKQNGQQAKSDTPEESSTMKLAHALEDLTHLESRVTILGHLQRGGTPSARDRVLASQLGVACTKLLRAKDFGNMVAIRGEETTTVPLQDVAGKRKYVPLDHPWVESARKVGTSLGD
jgi:6-phosphofructokinase 1